MSLFNPVAVQNPRQIAARILMARQQGGQYTETLLENELAGHRLSPADRGLCHELVFGVVRREATLDWLIARKTGGRTQKPLLRAILQMALYQMFWLERIPNHASVNEAVELAKRSGFGSQAGFVNAVLRGYAREFPGTQQLLADLKTSDAPIGHSHPAWLYERWRTRWGPEPAARLMEWDNSPPPTYARLNALKTGPEQLSAQWQAEGVKFVPRIWDWTEPGQVFELESHPPLARLPSFQDGRFYLQDPSTLLAVRELGVRPGETVLDLCAAPGGKTALIAQHLRNQGLIVASDIQPDRLEMVLENCSRLGVTCVETALLAGNSSLESRAGQFDRVLVDAPCSNTGVMRRRIDLRWRIRPEEILRLAESQYELLQKAAPLCKPGATLVYSTCSLEPEENRAVVDRFLKEQPGFRLETERSLLPFSDGVDGAYVARMARGSKEN